MKFKKKKKGSMGYFYSLSPGDPKLNAEIFNHNMGSNSTTSNSEACGESLNEKFTSIIPSLKDLENNSYTFITKETYIQGDWVPLRVVLSNYYTNKDAVKIDIYRVDDNRKINSYIGSYDFIVDKLKEFDIYEKPKKNESIIENLNDKLYSLSKELEEIKDDWSLDYLDIHKQSDDEIRIELGCQDKKYLNRHQDEIEDNLNAVIEKYDPMASFNRVGNHFDCYLYLKESINESQKKNEYEVTYIDRDTDSVTKGFVQAYSTKQAALIFKKQRKDVYKILSIECVEDHSKDDGEQLSLFEDGPGGEGNLCYFIISLLRLFCSDADEKLDANSYQVHHKNFNHSSNKDFNVTNVCLLPSYDFKDVINNKYKSPNSSIHRKVKTLDDRGKQLYLEIIERYNAIDVLRSLQNGKIIYINNSNLEQDLKELFKNEI